MRHLRPLLLVLLAFISACRPEPASLLLVNGKIWTADDGGTIVQALAIRDGKIQATGTAEELQDYQGTATRVIDLQGRLVIPGFNDAHIHFLGGSRELSEVDLGGAMNGEEVVRRVNAYAAEHPEKLWITGRGWQYTWFPSGLPTPGDMSGMISDRPVYLRAYDGHSSWANEKALQLAGVTADSKVNGFGHVVLGYERKPTGALLETAADLVSVHVPKPSRAEKLDALRTGLKLAATLGITSLQNASGSLDELSLYEELLSKQELTARYSAALSVDEFTPQTVIDSFAAKREVYKTNPMLHADAIKFMLDGVIESHTAAMIEPYDDEPDSRGDFAMPLESYRQRVQELDKAGFRIYTHAIGDKAVRESLNAYEEAQRKNGPGPRRHRIEHIETVSPKDLPRFAQLGVLASMEPIHADPGTMGVWQKAIGADRLPFSFAWASLKSAGATLVFSSDWPACIDINPIRGVHVAVNRRTPEGFPAEGWVAGQRVSITDALIAYTRTGAYASFEEASKGQLKPGYLADLVVLSDDLFTIDPMKIASTMVEMTIVDGKVVWESGR
jgi:hypothetical protein